MTQIARPDSDISLGTWSPYPVDPTTLHDKIDEDAPGNGDTDYITSDLDEDECEVGVGGAVDPGVGTGHVIRCYAKSVNGKGAKEQMYIALVENGNVRGQSPAANVDRTGYGLIEYALPEAEANTIQNYPDLRLRFHITKVNGGEPIRITQADFRCPDAAEEHSGTGSISGNGSVVGAIKKGGLGSAIKSAGGTLLAIGLAGMLGIASIAGGGTQIGLGEKAVSGTVSVSGSGTQVVSGRKIASGDLSISGGGSVVATGEKAEGEPHFGTASISGNGDLATGGIKQATVDVTVGANGVLSGVGEKQSLGDSVVTGGGSVIATGEKYEGEAHSGVAVVSGNGVIDAAVIKQALGDLGISGNGILDGNGIKQAPGSLAIIGNGGLNGAGIKQVPGDSTIIGGGSIVAVGTMSESHSGVAIVSESGVIDVAGLKQTPGDLVMTGGGSIVAAGYGQEAFIEVAKTVFLKSKLTERLVELKSTIKPSIVLNSEIKPEGEE